MRSIPTKAFTKNRLLEAVIDFTASRGVVVISERVFLAVSCLIIRFVFSSALEILAAGTPSGPPSPRARPGWEIPSYTGASALPQSRIFDATSSSYRVLFHHYHHHLYHINIHILLLFYTQKRLYHHHYHNYSLV
jgi:hypothetical protein